MVGDDLQLTIIVVSWNTQSLLSRCLESISRERRNQPPGWLELFVVDNASDDGSVQMVREQFPWVILHRNMENIGFARANNQGIRKSRGRYVLILNSDTEIHPGALENLVRFMDAHPQAAAAGPQLLNTDGTLQPGCHPMLTPEREFWRLAYLDRLWPLATYPVDFWVSRNPHQVEVIKGACLMLRREAIVQVGLLDEQFFFYTEEMDLCYRLAQKGWQLWYVPSAVVTHHGGASSQQMAEEMYLQLYRSKVQFHRKIGGKKRALYFKFLLVLAYFPRAILEPSNRIYRHLLRETPKM